MLISPSDHYVLHETVAASARDLRLFIDEVIAIGTDTDCEVYWRGQADHRWGVQSSLARVTAKPTALTDADLTSAERDLLAEAKRWVTAVPTTPTHDLEWLALLQHHGVPTRMLDFTSNALIATFFAVEDLDDVEGRLFAIVVPKTHTVGPDDAPGFQIGHLPLGELRVWQPRSQVSPRLVAQEGVFAVGRLPSTTPARHVLDNQLDRNRLMTRSEVVSIISIPLYLVGTDRGRNRRSNTYPSCFTARIHVDKSSIREQLARRTRRGDLRPPAVPIDHSSCYPDVEGMRVYSSTIERVRRGLS